MKLTNETWEDFRIWVATRQDQTPLTYCYWEYTGEAIEALQERRVTDPFVSGNVERGDVRIVDQILISYPRIAEKVAMLNPYDSWVHNTIRYKELSDRAEAFNKVLTLYGSDAKPVRFGRTKSVKGRDKLINGALQDQKDNFTNRVNRARRSSLARVEKFLEDCNQKFEQAVSSILLDVNSWDWSESKAVQELLLREKEIQAQLEAVRKLRKDNQSNWIRECVNGLNLPKAVSDSLLSAQPIDRSNPLV